MAETLKTAPDTNQGTAEGNHDEEEGEDGEDGMVLHIHVDAAGSANQQPSGQDDCPPPSDVELVGLRGVTDTTPGAGCGSGGVGGVSTSSAPATWQGGTGLVQAAVSEVPVSAMSAEPPLGEPTTELPPQFA